MRLCRNRNKWSLARSVNFLRRRDRANVRRHFLFEIPAIVFPKATFFGRPPRARRPASHFLPACLAKEGFAKRGKFSKVERRGFKVKTLFRLNGCRLNFGVVAQACGNGFVDSHLLRGSRSRKEKKENQIFFHLIEF